MNIAVLGGSFDPPHIWHYWTAQQILENTPGIDQVWLLPDFANAFKPIAAEPWERVEMLHSMESGRIKLSTIAIAKETITYTVDIVQDLLRDPYNTYYWVVGSDVPTDFARWRDYQKLSRMIKFLVFPRKDYPIRHLPPGFEQVKGMLLLSNISSSLIRERIKQRKTITGLVFPEVEEYIIKKRLYT
jgi:nicotinate-nucleotide adenylyltransferase